MPKPCPPVQDRAAIASSPTGAPTKLDDFYCRETEFVKDRNSPLAPTACLNRKECLDKNLREK